MMKTVYHTLSWLKFVACEVDETFVKRGYDYAKQEFERLSVKDYKKMGYRQQNKTDSL